MKDHVRFVSWGYILAERDIIHKVAISGVKGVAKSSSKIASPLGVAW